MGIKDKWNSLFGGKGKNKDIEDNNEQKITDTDESGYDDHGIENTESADDVENVENVENDEKSEQAVNAETVENVDDFKTEQNTENAGNTENTEKNDDAEKQDEIINTAVTEDDEETIAEKPVSKGFFARLKDGLAKTRNSFNDKIDNVLKAFVKVDEDMLEELEEALIMADVGVETSVYIIECLRDRIKSDRIKEPNDVKNAIEEIISEILEKGSSELDVKTTPSVIMVIGVNGVGKTTSIGKMAARFTAQGKKVILGAADTFRAAAAEQLEIWAKRSGIDMVKHREGSDPASVVFDTIAAAKARKCDVIILDTAGRLHNKKNLMDELAKIFRVTERELPGCSKEVLLVLDATTGQNAVNQAKLFSDACAITGIILTKLDGSAKGGIVLAIAHEHGIPVKLVGVGEGIDDLQEFNPHDFAKAMFE